MARDAKRELVDFLIARAFDPVLRAKADSRSQHDAELLENVQRSTKAEIERYRGYGSAEEVVRNFKRDLTSTAAKKVHRQLERLHLPTLQDIREEFERKAEKLGVQATA